VGCPAVVEGVDAKCTLGANSELVADPVPVTGEDAPANPVLSAKAPDQEGDDDLRPDAIRQGPGLHNVEGDDEGGEGGEGGEGDEGDDGDDDGEYFPFEYPAKIGGTPGTKEDPFAGTGVMTNAQENATAWIAAPGYAGLELTHEADGWWIRGVPIS
jgi:hypothetical protein